MTKRKTSSVPTKIYTYGCLAPTEGKELIPDIIQKSHNYYNVLIDIENERRAAYRKARSEVTVVDFEARETEVKDLSEKLSELRTQIKEINRSKKKRVKSEEVDAIKAEIATLSENRRAACAELTEAKKTIAALVEPARTEFKKRMEERLQKLVPEGKPSPHTIAAVKVEVLDKMLGEKKWPELWKVTARNDQAAIDKIKAARSNNGLHYMTSGLIDKAIESARTSMLDPSRHRWTGTGRIGGQILEKISTSDVFACESNFFQIDPLPKGTWDRRGRRVGTKKGKEGGGKRMAGRTKVRIRVGSDESRQPIWVELPVILHRKLPEGVIKYAWIKVSRVGLDTRYELQITLESSEFEARRCGTGTVAVHVGWRKREVMVFDEELGEEVKNTDVLVACCVDDRGRTQELALPLRLKKALISRENHQTGKDNRKAGTQVPYGVSSVDSLRHFRDIHFEDTRRVLLDHIGTARNKTRLHKAVTKVVGEEKATLWLDHLHSWRNPNRMCKLAEIIVDSSFEDAEIRALWTKWKAERLRKGLDLFTPTKASEKEGTTAFQEITAWASKKGVDDSKLLAVYMEWWRLKHRHLFQWESHLRDKLQARRKNEYRNWAAYLAQKYEFIVFRDIDLSKIARLPTPEQDETVIKEATALRRFVAPSEFKNTVIAAFGHDRVSEVEIESVVDMTEKQAATAILERHFVGAVAAE